MKEYMKKNGFTLVELLAIIVLLAIIAVVSSPIILNTIQNSKKSGFSSSVSGIKNAIENDYSDNAFDSNKRRYSYEKGALYDSSDKVVPMSGGISDGYGEGIVDDKGNVKLWIYNGQYCGTIGYEKKAGVSVTECKGIDDCKKICEEIVGKE